MSLKAVPLDAELISKCLPPESHLVEMRFFYFEDMLIFSDIQFMILGYTHT